MTYHLIEISNQQTYAIYRKTYPNIPSISAQALVHQGGVDEKAYEKDMCNRLQDHKVVYMIIALVDQDQSKVVAVATGWPFPTKDGARFRMQNLAVSKSERGKGIGTKMLHMVCNEFLPKHKYVGLDVEVGQKSLVVNEKFYGAKMGGKRTKVFFSFESGQQIDKSVEAKNDVEKKEASPDEEVENVDAKAITPQIRSKL